MKQKMGKIQFQPRLAIQDVVTADLVYRKALAGEIGIKLKQF
jgi:hypothetical protein